MSETKDPAFLFYPGDASEDTQFMNRLERGGYFDILKAQKKFKRFSLAQIKKVLGGDFETCWPAIELVLGHDEAGYFIIWLDTSIKKRAAHSKIQKERINKYWDEKKNQTDTKNIPRNNHGTSVEVPLENEIENEIGIENKTEVKGGTGGFEITLKVEIPDNVLEAAEMNQFTHTQKNNTEFIKSQWKVFLSERMNDPPRTRHKTLSELTSHFLNWIRNKHPKVNGKNNSGSTGGKPIPTGQISKGGFGKL